MTSPSPQAGVLRVRLASGVRCGVQASPGAVWCDVMAMTTSRGGPVPREPVRSGVAQSVTAAVAVLSLVGALLGARNGTYAADGSVLDALLGSLVNVTAAAAGVLIVSRYPRHLVGWCLIVLGAGSAAHGLVREAAVLALAGHAQPGPVALAGAWIAGWSWAVPLFALVAVLAFLPDGAATGAARFLGRMLAAGGAAVVVGTGLHPALLASEELPRTVENPVALLSARVADTLVVAGLGVLPVVAIAGLVVLVRRAVGGEARIRQQLLLLASVAALLLVLAALPVGDTPLLVGVALFPAAVLVATVRLGLFDVDALVARALATAALAALIALTYAAAVAGAGIAVGTERGTVVAVAVTAFIALLLQPVKRLCDLSVQRVVHGHRLSTSELLELLEDATRGRIDQVPQRVAEVLLAVAPSVVGSRVSLTVHGEELVVAEAGQLTPQPALAQEVEVDDEALAVLELSFQEGSLAVEQDQLALRRLATSSTAALRNVALHSALAATARRLVSAHDEERHRIERDVHDGAQQQLIAAATHLGLARHLSTEPAVDGQLVLTADQLTAAMRDLRRLVRGLRPTVLADHGLAAALRDHAATTTLGYELEVRGDQKLTDDIEDALYWVAREALQNATKHAHAEHVVVTLTTRPDGAELTVEDDGVGLDPHATSSGLGLRNSRDRVLAHGGAFQLLNGPQHGTTVRAWIPNEPTGTAARRRPAGAPPPHEEARASAGSR